MPVTLITGASSGIGAELARLCARDGHDLVLIARRRERLEALRDELTATHDVQVHVLTLDLIEPDAVDHIMEHLTKEQVLVDHLINNAGRGRLGPFLDHAIEDHLDMLALNVRALTALTHRIGRQMAARGQGRILNVGSTAGMLPGPLQAVYYASKAYVNSFSLALSEELRGTGVTVSVLCPGPVDTDFLATAGMQRVSLLRSRPASAKRVARAGYEAMMKGRPIVVYPRSLRPLLENLYPLLPRRLGLRLSRKALEP